MSDKLDTPGCAYLCGCSGTLPFDDFGLSQTVTGQGAATEQDFERCIAGAPSNFAGLPRLHRTNQPTTFGVAHCRCMREV